MTPNVVFFNLRFFRRILLYLLGNFVLALGSILMVKSNLGIAPVNSVAYIASRLFSFDLGIMTALVYSVYVLLQFVILRKEFHPVNLLQIVIAVVFGWFISLNNRILSFPPSEIYWVRILFTLGGIVIIALGIFLYLKADLMPQPAEGLLLAIEKKTRWKLHKIKVMLDCALVILAASLSFIVAGTIIGIREGTLLAMLGVGKILGLFMERLGPKVNVLFKL